MSKQRLSQTASPTKLPSGFVDLLGEVKQRIQMAQTKALSLVNAELVRLYWDIGRMIHERQQREGWGASVIPRLSAELRNELPEVKGFSERNIKSMLAFHREYPKPNEFVQQPVAQMPSRAKVPQRVAQLALSSLLWQIPWGHHVLLLAKTKNLVTRHWYMEQTLANGWSRNTLTLMIDSQSHRRAGKAVSNFEQLLPRPQSDFIARPKRSVTAMCGGTNLLPAQPSLLGQVHLRPASPLCAAARTQSSSSPNRAAC